MLLSVVVLVLMLVLALVVSKPRGEPGKVVVRLVTCVAGSKLLRGYRMARKVNERYGGGGGGGGGLVFALGKCNGGCFSPSCGCGFFFFGEVACLSHLAMLGFFSSSRWCFAIPFCGLLFALSYALHVFCTVVGFLCF